MKKLILLVSLISFVGCTDATVSNLTSLGDAAEITCYSGGNIIYKGKSTGKVATTQNSDGWEFRDASNGKFIRVSGACVVIN